MAVNDYCTATEIKAVMPDVSWGSTYDAVLEALAKRASRAIDRYVNRKPGAFYVSADVTRYFTGDGSTLLQIGELAAAPTTVQVAETGVLTTLTTWESTDYLCWPYNALDDGQPYTRLDIDIYNGTKSTWYAYPKAIKIAGKFGYSATVPDDVKQTAIIQTVRWFKRGQQAYSDTGAIVELGQLTYTKALDPDVALLIDHLRVQAI